MLIRGVKLPEYFITARISKISEIFFQEKYDHASLNLDTLVQGADEIEYPLPK